MRLIETKNQLEYDFGKPREQRQFAGPVHRCKDIVENQLRDIFVRMK
jgi:hypothetical protein